jgi:D-serine dehydratase
MTVTKTPLRERELDCFEKGIPADVIGLPLGGSGARVWNVLDEDLPLPVAVIRKGELLHNIAWMRRFLNNESIAIAPHGKTTMSPTLFDLQLADGAWGMTLSTPHQLQVARGFGYKKIFYANQLVGRGAIDFVMRELARDPAFEFYCLVDSERNANALAEGARRCRLERRLPVLVEIGYLGGRTGCRSVEEALRLARAVNHLSDTLELAGIEGFEGLFKGATNKDTRDLVIDFMCKIREIAERCDSERLFRSGRVLLSAGGSAFYDLVSEGLRRISLSQPVLVLLRAGCYITHDTGLYVRAVNALRERDPALAGWDGGLRNALEVWAYVQSRPEPGKAILAFGKRDASHDDPPVPLVWWRPGGAMAAPEPVPEGHAVTRLNDQHAHVTVPENSPWQVGDMVAVGISHPCLTFDKWRVIHIVNDRYEVVNSLRTYF